MRLHWLFHQLTLNRLFTFIFNHAWLNTSAVLFFACSNLAWAQNAVPDSVLLPAVEVTGNRLIEQGVLQSESANRVLSGASLREKADNNLGAVLSNELGIHSSGFAPGAGRPIVHGLDGARVRMMQNGMGTHDVSNLSADHAVSAESSSAQQIEVLQGAATLLYGSGIVGGLVNVVNERIASQAVQNLMGEAQLQAGTGNHSASNSVNLDMPHPLSSGAINLHLDGFARSANNYTIPAYAIKNNRQSDYQQLGSSFARAQGGGIGASLVQDWGYAGASLEQLNSHYGIPGSEGHSIRMNNQRLDLQGAWNNPLPGIEKFKFKFSNTQYQHQELSSDSSPTVLFSNHANEARAEWLHAPLAGWRGNLGLQQQTTQFSASSPLGETVVVPPTHANSLALFVLEERQIGNLMFNIGARAEMTRLQASGNNPQRQFNLQSYSSGFKWQLAPTYSLNGTLDLGQRAASIEELYSQGPHDASGTYDLGNAQLQKERSRSLALSFAKTQGAVRWKINVFQTQFDNFIFGSPIDSNGDGLADRSDAHGNLTNNGAFLMRQYTQANAHLYGGEAELSWNKAASAAANWQGWFGRTFVDSSRLRLSTHTSNNNSTNNLYAPLQPPTRIGLEWGYQQIFADAAVPGTLRSVLSLVHAFAHTHIAPYETSTPAYTLLNARVDYILRFVGATRLGVNQVSLFLQGRNLLNQEVRLSTSTLKDSAPQPGRSVQMGLHIVF